MRMGEATNASHVCQRLADRGLDVHVLTSTADAIVPDPRITVHPVMRTWSWSEVPRLVRFLKTCAPDVVYLMYLGWMYNHQFMSTFIPTIAKRVLPDARCVTRFENISGAGPQTNSGVSRVLRKIIAACDRQGQVDYQFGTLLRDSDHIILLSARHEVDLEERLPGVGKKCALIPPPANMRMSDEQGGEARRRGRQMLALEPEEFAIAYIGFVYPGKGIETLLHSYKQVSVKHPHVRLVVIGGGLARQFPDQPNYLEDMHKLAEDLGIAGRVIWTGDYGWDSEDASLYLRAADAAVLPFDTGVKLNNSSFSSAAAHGLPIITTEPEGLEPQFLHEKNVYLCAPKSPEAMAQAVETLIGSEPLRRRLGEGALQLAREWYAWDSALDKTLALFGRPRPSQLAPSPLADSRSIS